MPENNYEVMSDISSSIEGVDDIYNEIMYHVLGQFLVTKNNKNIATVLDELTTEIKTLRKSISRDVQNLSNILKTVTVTDETINNLNNDCEDNNSICAQMPSLASVSSPSLSPLQEVISSNNEVVEN